MKLSKLYLESYRLALLLMEESSTEKKVIYEMSNIKLMKTISELDAYSKRYIFGHDDIHRNTSGGWQTNDIEKNAGYQQDFNQNVAKRLSYLDKDLATSDDVDALKTGLIAGAAALAAIIAGSFLVYRRFFSQAAKHCKGFSGKPKTECMKQFRAQALAKQIAFIKSKKGICRKSKNSEKCLDAVNRKIAKLEFKLSKVKE